MKKLTIVCRFTVCKATTKCNVCAFPLSGDISLCSAQAGDIGSSSMNKVRCVVLNTVQNQKGNYIRMFFFLPLSFLKT